MTLAHQRRKLRSSVITFTWKLGAVKKAKKINSHAAKSVNALEADNEEMEALLKEQRELTAKMNKAQKKQKTHTGHVHKHTQGVADALEEGME